jgi:uncharacterized protein (TIGR03435 family)
MKAFLTTCIPTGRCNFSTIIILLLVILLLSAYAEGPSFEVASIRPAPPIDPRKFIDTSCHGGPGTKEPSRWTCSNVLLPNLVISAFDLKGLQMQAVSSVPTERFSVAAKVPEGTTNEQFRQMQQNLLIDRFGLKFHREKREMQGYELILAKDGPKFEESKPTPKDPDTNPEAPLPAHKLGADGFPVLPPGRTVVVQTRGRARGQWIGMTLEDFAANLIGTGASDRRPIIDATGLKGKYDLSLEWAPESGNAAPMPQGAQSGIPTASEPSGWPNIFTALQKQLGLKLVPKKVTVEFLVIDHIEKTPTEN